MKYLIASDIHGSLKYARKLLDIFDKSDFDKLILLGDLYYHGPRNPLPEEYNPKEVSRLLNERRDRLLVVKGNCDAEVDQMISEFPFHDYLEINIFGKICSFYHGHRKIDLPQKSDIVFNGHTHICQIEQIDGIIYANPGSISLPKSSNSRDYLVFESHRLTLRDLESSAVIKSIDF